MRGIPKQAVTCTVCGGQNGCPKDQLCHRCRLALRPNPNKRFHWTTELDQSLGLAYQRARSRRELSESIDHLQRRTGFSRAAILSRATELHLSSERQAWTDQEIEILRELAGTLSKSAIARKLGRSYWSVKGAFSRMEISARLTDGYSREDAAMLLGVSARSIRSWISMGWLVVRDGRISEASMRTFLRRHSEEYSLNRVDEPWFKGMVFPSFGRRAAADTTRPGTKQHCVAGLDAVHDGVELPLRS